MTEPAEPLAYATPGVESRILLTREGERATVVIHRPGRRAKKAREAVGELMAEGLLYFIIGAVVVGYAAPVWLLVILPGLAVVLGGVCWLSWLWYARLDEPMVIEVMPTELVFRNQDRRARPERLGREGLYAIRYVGHAKCIFVYRRGQEMRGFGVEEEGVEGERIAGFLREAAGLAEEN
jgi:hypothetical protein